MKTSKAIEKASRRSRSLVALLAFCLLCQANCAALAESEPSAHHSIAPVVIEDPDGAMLNFYRAMKGTEDEGVASIIHYGDSHIAAYMLTGSLRSRLQQRFGDAGTGFVLAGKPWNWYRRGAVTSLASGGWKAEGLGQSTQTRDGQFGLAGISFATDRHEEWLIMRVVCRRF